jgi:methylglutaconyl-CoA hydratase
MNYATIETEQRAGTAWIWLNRPDVRNAMNDQMIADLHEAFDALIADQTVHAIVVAGRGKAFCAGGDLSWMKTAKQMSVEAAVADSMRLALLLRKIHDCPKPTVARVQGPAYAGGMGIVAACDVSVCSSAVKFSLSEVKLGLTPATISPYVVKSMGANQARRYFLTGEVFDAAQAYRMGFIHEQVEPEQLDDAVQAILDHLHLGAPNALAITKQLLRDVTHQGVTDELSASTATLIAQVRASDEAQEGIKSFFEKRSPSWVNTKADKH